MIPIVARHHLRPYRRVGRDHREASCVILKAAPRRSEQRSREVAIDERIKHCEPGGSGLAFKKIVFFAEIRPQPERPSFRRPECLSPGDPCFQKTRMVFVSIPRGQNNGRITIVRGSRISHHRSITSQTSRIEKPPGIGLRKERCRRHEHQAKKEQQSTSQATPPLLLVLRFLPLFVLCHFIV